MRVGTKWQEQVTLPGQAENRKLRLRYIGPFRILEKISPLTYRLALPRHLRLHSAFHVDRLKRWQESSRGHRVSAMELGPIDEQTQEYEVEEILRSRMVRRGRGKRREFLIRWKGYPLHDATWEPERNLHCPEKLQEFLLRETSAT